MVLFIRLVLGAVHNCQHLCIRTERTEGRGARGQRTNFLMLIFLNCCHLAAMIERLQRHITDCCATAVIYKKETRSHLGNAFKLECLLAPLV